MNYELGRKFDRGLARNVKVSAGNIHPSPGHPDRDAPIVLVF